MNRSQETRLKKLGAKLGQVRSRRYVFHYDEVAEAEAQGLPYALLPRVLSKQEWLEKYGAQPVAQGEPRNTFAAPPGCEVLGGAGVTLKRRVVSAG